jgi:phage-related protein
MKPIIFAGDSLDATRGFPERARQALGYQLDRVQCGLEPSDWKPMNSIGTGVREIRVREDNGAYRVIYLTSLPDAIHVLHAFQKKSSKTPQRDLDIAQRRLGHLQRSVNR